MESIEDAFKRLKVTTHSIDDDTYIDKLLQIDEARPVKPKPLSKEKLRISLEEEFVTPATNFSSAWLNNFQKRWQPQLNYSELYQTAPTQTRTVVRFKREGLGGRVTGYDEVTIPASSTTAKNSTSILRKPANRANFVRGAAGNFPFIPGGLEGIDSIVALNEEEEQQSIHIKAPKISNLDRVIPISSGGNLLEIAPGLLRGMKTLKLSKEAQKDAETIEQVLQQEPEPVSVKGLTTAHETQRKTDDNDLVEQDEEDEDIIDTLIPNEFPTLAPHGDLKPSTAKRDKKEWAHVVDVNREIHNFHELVPNMAREWPFELDTFQKEAVYHLENGDSVFVAAHTSAGKTVVAEYAIALAKKHMTKAIYTSPIKALSNQKFRDFRETFDDVGILTGDVQIRPEASCLIMTTEILRSMLYRGADLIRDVEFVIFDEVHYVNDLERGVVWEEVIIMLPDNVTFILLSATVPNTKEFASWVGRTKQKNIYVISTMKRPVPLEHYIWAEKDVYKIVNADKQFIEKGWKQANDILSGTIKNQAREEKLLQSGGNDARGNNQRGRGRGNDQRGHIGRQRGASQTRGRGTSSNAGRGNIARTGRGGMRTSAQQDKTLWVGLVQYLRKKELLPACIFVFSKKRCEQNAEALYNLDFCTSDEKSKIHMTVERSMARLKPEDRTLPQITRTSELLSRGFAVHHGGMLPILKEVVELLFADGLVKVLFATETFAMGLNLPTRTVIFSGFRKHDGKAFRDLLPGEYTQMAGRAGRRGKDTVGTVVIVTPGADEAPPQTRLKQMMLGEPTKLRSQFRLTYNMILNLLRVEALQIEEMIKRSFSENATQALLPEHEKGIAIGEAELRNIKREECSICDIDLEQCHTACIDYTRINSELHVSLANHAYGKHIMLPKRLVIFSLEGIRQVGMIIQAPFIRGSEVAISIMKFSSFTKGSDGDLFPYLPVLFSSYCAALPRTFNEISWEPVVVSIKAIECVTRGEIKFEGPLKQLNKKNKKQLQQFQILAETELLPLFRSWKHKDWNEFDWSRVRDLGIRAIFDQRTAKAGIIANSECLGCPNFALHFNQQHAQWVVTEDISRLRQLMSDQNLSLLPDYEQRIWVLKELQFIDEHSRVELKGKVACEIHSSNELILTELILENVFADFTPEEIVALLSVFVFQEKTEAEPALTSSLERGKKKILEIAERVTDLQIKHQVLQQADESYEFAAENGRFGMVEVVYEWARGMSFNRITELTDVMEGTIVRVITRLDETCREVKGAARIIGDPTLFKKMEQCQEMIKRDVCAVASLYM